jgi:hypothetical protein
MKIPDDVEAVVPIIVGVSRGRSRPSLGKIRRFCTGTGAATPTTHDRDPESSRSLTTGIELAILRLILRCFRTIPFRKDADDDRGLSPAAA